MFIPAFMSLWVYHYEINMHYKRYTKIKLKTKLLAEKLAIQKLSYWNFFLFILVYSFIRISILLNKNKKGEAAVSIKNDFTNKSLLLLLTIENKLLKIFNFSFGVSIFCIAKKIK